MLQIYGLLIRKSRLYKGYVNPANSALVNVLASLRNLDRAGIMDTRRQIFLVWVDIENTPWIDIRSQVCAVVFEILTNDDPVPNTS